MVNQELLSEVLKVAVLLSEITPGTAEPEIIECALELAKRSDDAGLEKHLATQFLRRAIKRCERKT
jgi:hypothetical protein